MGTFKTALTNSNTYLPGENIFYAYTGNTNHIEIVKISENKSIFFTSCLFLRVK